MDLSAVQAAAFVISSPVNPIALASMAFAMRALADYPRAKFYFKAFPGSALRLPPAPLPDDKNAFRLLTNSGRHRLADWSNPPVTK